MCDTTHHPLALRGPVARDQGPTVLAFGIEQQDDRQSLDMVAPTRRGAGDPATPDEAPGVEEVQDLTPSDLRLERARCEPGAAGGPPTHLVQLVAWLQWNLAHFVSHPLPVSRGRLAGSQVGARSVPRADPSGRLRYTPGHCYPRAGNRRRRHSCAPAERRMSWSALVSISTSRHEPRSNHLAETPIEAY